MPAYLGVDVLPLYWLSVTRNRTYARIQPRRHRRRRRLAATAAGVTADCPKQLNQEPMVDLARPFLAALRAARNGMDREPQTS